jgi:hypothetical protein
MSLLAAVPVVVGLLVPAAGAADPAPPSAASRLAVQGEKKVTICHRTNSRTNPYNQIVVSTSSAIEGHAGHTGPIFGPDVEDWGDIIAPIRPGLPRGRNWPEGRAILRNGCEMEPDVGPEPSAVEGDVECIGTTPSAVVTVTNGADATRPAFFRIFVAGAPVRLVGPLAPGASETVVLSAELQPYEDQTFTVEVRSGGKVVASRVVTVDCAAAPPRIETQTSLECGRRGPRGELTVTNNSSIPVRVRARADGQPLGPYAVIAPGATVTGTFDLSQYEDQTVTLRVRVDGVMVGTYTVTPDCVAPEPVPKVSVAGQVCPPPTSTVTLSNNGDPASHEVFVIRVDGRAVLRTAPLYGGDTTTVVVDLSRYEDRTVVVSLHANGRKLGSRTIAVDCARPSPAGGAGGGGGGGPGPVTAPS